ncbi:MAG: DUF1294 domain-containing protein [Eubacteriales bacterium]|nr:DUF1294 domain-containing protein [Eubacteriales bacterium]
MWKWIAGALLAVNIGAFFAMGLDKRRARKGQWRISEKALMLWALLGGAWGALLGMQHFRHKTQKPLFRWGVPALCVLETALAIALFLVFR